VRQDSRQHARRPARRAPLASKLMILHGFFSKGNRVKAATEKLLAALASAGRLSPMHLSRRAVGAVIAVLLSGNTIAGALEDCAAAYDRKDYAAALQPCLSLATLRRALSSDLLLAAGDAGAE
jgi:hypothetical protein